jgi:hypothetical protein
VELHLLDDATQFDIPKIVQSIVLSIPRTKELFTRYKTPSTTIMEPQETFIDKLINLVFGKDFH